MSPKKLNRKQDEPEPQATTVWLTPEDVVLVAKLREHFKLNGLNNGQVIRVALNRILEDQRVA